MRNIRMTPTEKAEQRIKIACVFKHSKVGARNVDREFTLEEIAFVMDLTTQAVSAIEQSALKRIRDFLKRSNLREVEEYLYLRGEE